MDIKQLPHDRGDRISYIRIISLVPALMMMVIIFVYSSKPAVVSDGTSTPIANAVLSLYEIFFGEIDIMKRHDYLNTANYIVRKTAHVTEYILLALCISWPLWIRKLRGKKLILFAFASSLAYAGTDEIHQLFIEGRSGNLRDVGIDAIGCAIGTVVFWILAIQIEKRRKAKKF